ncbi:MAG: PHP-associated domain-containing protein [Nitrososphaerales archaeon]
MTTKSDSQLGRNYEEVQYELRAELHVHSVFSNFQNSKSIPYDCGTTPEQICYAMVKKNLKALVITDHNTDQGYRHLIGYKNNHERFKGIQIYRGEEVTVEGNKHVTALFIDGYIKPYQSIEETLEEIKEKNGIAVAVHPFAVRNGIRGNAVLLDHVEVFNSNNPDEYSNQKAEEFAEKHNKIKVGGSDSHLKSTVGRCVNQIESENNLDALRDAMKVGRIRISETERNLRTFEESLEHAHYSLSNSREYILKDMHERYQELSYFSRDMIKKFLLKNVSPCIVDTMVSKSPESQVYKICGKVFLYFIKRTSKKVNVDGENPVLFEDNFWWNILKKLF